MTNIKISKNALYLVFFSWIMLMPAYVVENLPIIKTLNNLVAVCMILFVVKEKFRLLKMGVAIAVYYVYLIVNTYVHGQGEIHFLVSTIKMGLFLYVVDIMLNKNYKKSINILYNLFVILFLADVISILLFPEGLYRTTTIWNEWSSSIVEGWLLGNKNNHVLWYLVTIYLTYIKQKMTGLRKYKRIWHVVMLLALVSVIRMHSSTSIIVILIADVGMLYFQYRKNQTIHINMIVIGATYAVMQVLVLIGSANFLQPMITKVFGKDLTFSGRTTAWLNVCYYISCKPIWGWGQMTGEDSKRLLDNSAFVNSHNQWLQVLWEGGIIQLILLFIIFGVLMKQIQRCSKKEIADISKIVFTVVLIAMAFEVELGSLVTWLLIILCYHTNIYFNEEKQETLI